VDLYSDNLSDIPNDIFSDSECESDSECKRKFLSIDSNSERTSDESDNSSNTRNVGETKWAKKDKMPDLGQFTGNAGVKLFPSDPTNVSYITDLFFGVIFFDFLCEETNVYCFENIDKYDRNYKVLKWVDITVAELKKFFAIIILLGQVRQQLLPSATP
jgi:hypothetical protein